MALTEIKPGELAAVVTSLEMRARPAPRPVPDSPLGLARWQSHSPDKYRTLFRRVGAPWLWFSRLAMADEQLSAILDDPGVAMWAVVDRQGVEVGMLELDFREAGQCELSFLGLVPELAGQGHGGWLMTQALALAWRADVARVWVHTCSLDHPSALGFYMRWGFAPFARAVETFPDPRILGLLPQDCAPQIPLIRA